MPTKTSVSQPRPAGQPVYSTDGKRVIGTITGDTFTTKRAASKHMLRKPPAWAIDRAPLQRLASQGVTTVVVHDTEGRLVYTASIADFARHGFVIDRGYGVQAALKLGHWRIEVEGSDEFERAVTAFQLGLWGE